MRDIYRCFKKEYLDLYTLSRKLGLIFKFINLSHFRIENLVKLEFLRQNQGCKLFYLRCEQNTIEGHVKIEQIIFVAYLLAVYAKFRHGQPIQD